VETLIGTRISHYNILEQLGAGGMGVVFRAHDEQLDRDVAFKLLPDETVRSEAARSRLIREARTASQLSHPNICHVYEAGEAGEHVYIAMELLDGRALSEEIPEAGLPLETILRIGAQIAEALAHAHGKGVIHRDLKANNVIVTTEGRAVVLDFGLAKRDLMEDEGSSELASVTLTKTGVVMGTPAYLSPEVLQGGRATAQSDIWALGVVLYDMASGGLPFHGRSMAELCGAILKDPPTPLPERVHPGLRAIVQRCLAKEPSQRYKLASEVQAALQALQAGSGFVGRHAHPRWSRLAVYAAGVAGTVVIVLLATDVGRWREQIGGGSSGASVRSLAVLPLANLSGDPRQEYFADGLTDELIADLASIKSLKVISRTSVMRYKGASKPLPDIARELGVDGIVEGSVLRSGDRVRIKVELIEAARDRHLWTQSYDRDMRDVLAMQSEVGRDIAERINVQISPREQALATKPRPVNPQAYELYLKGRYYWNKRNQNALLQALDNFDRAVRIDSGYADAYAGQADTYVLMDLYAGSPPRETYPRARAAALKALKLDEHLAEAHASLGRVKLFYDWDWTGAETEFRRAIELKPSLSTAHHWYSICLRDVGRLNEALAEAKRALELDPVSLIINTNLGDTFFYAGQFDRAVEQHRKTILLDAGFAPAHLYLGRALEQKGSIQEAVAEFRKARSLAEKGPYALGDLARGYALAGRRSDARGLLNELSELSKRGASLEPDIALVYLALGDRDQAFEHLEKAYKERSGLNDLKVDPRFGSLHGDPRFQDLLVRLGLSS
jgi:TolB-like protein/Flp pilus assembly protein TadD